MFSLYLRLSLCWAHIACCLLQEMTSNNRILEIKSLLDTERLIKEEEIAKANQETAVVRAQMAQVSR